MPEQNEAFPRVGPGDVETVTMLPDGDVWTDRGGATLRDLRKLGTDRRAYVAMRAAAKMSAGPVRVRIVHGWPRPVLTFTHNDRDVPADAALALLRVLARQVLAARRVTPDAD